MKSRLFYAAIPVAIVAAVLCLTGCDPTQMNGAESLVMVDELPSATPPADLPQRNFKKDVLFFAGSGTWTPEVSTLRQLLQERNLSYREVTQQQLNSMDLDALSEYGMILWPGGSGGTQMATLSSSTKTLLRRAVRERGVGWLGFCAGAFVAVGPKPAPGANPAYGLAVVFGQELEYYAREAYYVRNGGTDIEMTLETFADGSQRDLVWYGGPMTPSGPGLVVAKYPDGTPAISQMWSGNGFVMLSAVHPAAPQSIRDSNGLRDSDGMDLELTVDLISATLNQASLPAFSGS